ncbi:TIGR01457 family HAD-type hydrolase [Ectobacillus antri]|jgi:4-nitrophenyl phosphatase|uniref:Acid sugar phosphatase n=1 Tax=Ectobacillus antri TaxID=2486280 RepID=A0ABT6HAD1_9BACI|nr:TIGR01457 family HAD-type hydrolase [Ectobacillus antri]MDG4658247.1 TIGR01457 family HAD-type hydrolase [Ectobacillus antri]MDG5755674.1 TIGR01457 family HAD-type hydrolase [Ectobacillus antri]
MKRYKAYLIDLDGTMYRGEEKIEEASDFVKQLVAMNIPYLFVTNNSSRRPEQVADKLRSLDIPAGPEHVFTTSMAAANYMYAENPEASVYMIGEEGLEAALKEKEFRFEDENPDYVIMGIDRDITYEKLAKACLAVRKGAKFISTNGDIALPTERGLMPGNGSLTSVVAVSTQIKPLFIGKPEPIIMEQALKEIGVSPEDTLMVGDNYDTDILAGIRAGVDTLLVHTGVTTPDMLTSYKTQPTYVVHSLTEWMDKI